MIYEVLEIIREQVALYLDDIGLGQNIVTLDNIGQFVDDPNVSDQNMDDKVVLSLLNIEEETVLKNRPHTIFKNGQYIQKNNPINLNLYVLFCCNRSAYSFSLRSLAGVIEFFQGKKVFNQTNTVFSQSTQVMQRIKEFYFTAELYTPTFEELNYIWGTLGGKSYPSALFKFNLVSLERNHELQKGLPITTVSGDLTQYN